MNKHWFRNLLALLVMAALLVSMGAVAEGIEVTAPDEVVIEQVIMIGAEGLVKEGTEMPKGSGESDLPDYGCLSASPSSVSIAVGGRASVVVTFTEPSGTVYWASSDQDVATCQWAGGWSGDDTVLYINGNAKGSATITISNSQNGDTTTISVTVGGSGGGSGTGCLSVNPSKISVKAGDSKPVTVTYTEYGTVTWKSSNEAVATGTWAGGWSGDDTVLYVNGVSKGSATITISNDQNSDTAKIKVTVKKGSSSGGTYPKKGKKDGKATYRALLIGEEAFSPICTRNRGDVTLMKKVLSKRYGAKLGKWSITCKYDLNNSGVKSAIYSKFKKADEDDVSLFFIATHGDVDTTGSTAGALAMIPSGFLTMGELATALKAVPGKVIIIVESCGSGAGVFTTVGEQNSAAINAIQNSVKAFDQAVIDAFAAADEGVIEGGEAYDLLKGADAPNTGELRVKNKFYVLTASRYQEYSWGSEYYQYNYFTKWLTHGVGTSGKMKADSNKNKKLTLKELFKYISKVGDNYGFYSDGQYYYQHVQVYPKNSSFILFRRK